MKTNRLILFLALALLALALSACGTPSATTWPGLSADANAAYLANGTAVYAIRLSDGAQLWTFPEKADSKLAFYANPVLTTDGKLLLGSSGSNDSLFLVDAQSGQLDWTFNGAGDHWVASPLVVDNIVYAPNTDGNLYIFDLSIPGDTKLIDTVELGGDLWAQPVSDGQKLYVTSLDHHIYVVDLKTHKVENSIQLGGAIPGAPALGDGMLYVGSFDSTMAAVNISDGSIVWNTPVSSWVWDGPALEGGKLYFGDLKGNFYIVNAADGTIEGSFKPDDAILASPIVVDGKLVFTTENGAVYSFEPGGTSPLSLEKLDAKVYTAPVTAGNLILVAPFQSKTTLLVALDKDGKQVWSFFPQK